MPGHNAIEELNKDGIVSHGGQLLYVGPQTAVANTQIPSGFAHGAIWINTASSGTYSGVLLLVNAGTVASSNWQTVVYTP